MNELEILNYYQLAFVANAIYCLTFAALIFITFIAINSIKIPSPSKLNKYTIPTEEFL